jgi:hypothetical protein
VTYLVNQMIDLETEELNDQNERRSSDDRLVSDVLDLRGQIQGEEEVDDEERKAEEDDKSHLRTCTYLDLWKIGVDRMGESDLWRMNLEVMLVDCWIDLDPAVDMSWKRYYSCLHRRRVVSCPAICAYFS